MNQKQQQNQELMNLHAQVVEMMHAGKAMEVFEKFYAEDVVMDENGSMTRVGKEANRKLEEDFFSKATDYSIKLLAASFNVDDNGVGTVVAVWHQKCVHSEWGPMDSQQGSITKWKDGKVISESFNYPTNATAEEIQSYAKAKMEE